MKPTPFSTKQIVSNYDICCHMQFALIYQDEEVNMFESSKSSPAVYLHHTLLASEFAWGGFLGYLLGNNVEVAKGGLGFHHRERTQGIEPLMQHRHRRRCRKGFIDPRLPSISLNDEGKFLEVAWWVSTFCVSKLPATAAGWRNRREPQAARHWSYLRVTHGDATTQCADNIANDETLNSP